MKWKIALLEQVEKFIESCSLEDRLRIKKVFNLFEEFGVALGSPYLKKISGTDNLWEFRIRNIRLLFFLKRNVGIIVHGFVKKSWRVPKRELEIAKKRSKLVKELI